MGEGPPTVRVLWQEGYRFLCTDDAGHEVIVDAPSRSGGGDQGFTPGNLLLAALGGCTGMDVVHILKRRRQQISGLEVQVWGERAEGYPAYYTKIYVKYIVRGKGVEEEEVRRAIKLSEDVYCSVGATLAGRAQIISSYEIKRTD